MVRSGALEGVTARKAAENLVKALGKGLLKIMSKMGVSTVASYTGAQIFEAIGLGEDVIGTCFTGTTSRLGGIGFGEIADEAAARHRRAVPPRGAGPDHRRLETGGDYQWRREGEAAPVQPGDRVQAAARHPDPALRDLQGVHPAGGRPVGPADDAARPVPHPRRRRARRGTHRPTWAGRSVAPGPRVTHPHPDRRGRAGVGHRAPVLHRCHVLRLHLRRGAPDPGHRDEPAGRPVQHRRGRRGPGPLRPGRQRRPAPLRGQAGGQRPVRGDQ